MKYSILFSLVLSSLLVSCGSFQSKKESCLKKQAVVEYGTSRVKMFIAEMNTCSKQDFKTLGKAEWEVETNKNINQSPDGKSVFDSKVVEDLKNISENINRVTKNFKVEQVFGIATGVYRNLESRGAIFSALEKIIEGKIVVLTPEEEAQMGLRSIIASEKPAGNFVVWDFGGNNMQFSIVSSGKISSVIGLPGTNEIRNEVMSLLKKKKTPNPIGAKNIPLIEKHLMAKLSSNLEAMKVYKDIDIYGIGGVHSKSIATAIMYLFNDPESKKMYSQDQVAALLNHLASMNDSQIGGKFPEDQASNVLAVNMIMKHIGWRSVKVSEQTLALGYLLSK